MELGYDNININGGVRTKRSEPLRPLHFKTAFLKAVFFYFLMLSSIDFYSILC